MSPLTGNISFLQNLLILYSYQISSLCSNVFSRSSNPGLSSGYVPKDNVIVGNVCLYGATSGTAFFCGKAGERFAVRNSGASSFY